MDFTKLYFLKISSVEPSSTTKQYFQTLPFLAEKDFSSANIAIVDLNIIHFHVN